MALESCARSGPDNFATDYTDFTERTDVALEGIAPGLALTTWKRAQTGGTGTNGLRRERWARNELGKVRPGSCPAEPSPHSVRSVKSVYSAAKGVGPRPGAMLERHAETFDNKSD